MGFKLQIYIYLIICLTIFFENVYRIVTFLFICKMLNFIIFKICIVTKYDNIRNILLCLHSLNLKCI